MATHKGASLPPDSVFFFLLLHMASGSLTSCVMMTDNSQDFDEELQAKLLDPTKRFELWQRMNSAANPSIPCGMFPGSVALHLTPSGMVQGAGSSMDVPSGTLPAGFHGTPMWWPPFLPFSHLIHQLFPLFSLQRDSTLP